ncbi:MAG: polysaccharide export protein [Acidobacteriales bacterium]|nr:polysaccharide export protein [Terriglobales bacterium]
MKLLLLVAITTLLTAGEPTAAHYVLGPGDQLLIRAMDVDEISDKPVRIESSGLINLAMIGRLKAAGLTVEQLEADIAGRLKKFVQEPQVSVAVTEFRSQPVSLLGAVAQPGVHQLQGRKTLFEVLSLAGGLRQDAGHSIKITRLKENGPIPLPDAKSDETGRYSVASVNVKSVVEARNPRENIVVMPNDVISVPRAEMVYVVGAVKRSGGFVLQEREDMTVLQALSLAEGAERTAAAKRAKILRSAPNQSVRQEIPVNLKEILAGKAADVPMRADDILFVPSSLARSASVRAAEAAVQITTGLVIWRR